MADFDAVVIGAGCAGSAAAYELARAGQSVLLVERGNFAGAKNMTGGRLYTHALERLIPDFRDRAPLERRVTHERITLLADDAGFTIDFASQEMKEQGQESYTVLRAPFDQWLASEAEAAGAELICGIPVEDLIIDSSGVVGGIVAGGDEITADVTVICDGANSLLASKAVGARMPLPVHMAVGVKQVYELPADVITNRAMAQSNSDGSAWLFVGDCTKGHFGGGFAYTNAESISIGIVAGLEALANGGEATVCQMLEDFKAHPCVAPLIAGGKLVEHSGHMVPEGGFDAMPELVGDGALIAGDAAMMCLNLGYMVRGMDYAISAGQMAGLAAAEALAAGDVSKKGLSRYRDWLESSFVLKDLEAHRGAPEFLEGFDRMFDDYPKVVRDIMNGMFVVDGLSGGPLRDAVMPALKSVGIFNLFKDAKGALKNL
ncbi:MAG: FAD-dependent oxidoreductase [Eggerthellaceae bacterium]|nr:FAD-dependent oxidoreductase [Eggerthellaceae bacterium]